MLSFTDLGESRPENGLEAAQLYTRMGLCVVPCNGKRPIPKNWPELELGLEDLPRYFDDGQNVALILGEPSKGLVNVDLDVQEACKVADWFLPETLASGRESTPGSHRWYVSPGKNKKWVDTGGVVLLETRSTRSQPLVEPSKHPSGESYSWDRDGVLEPSEIDPEDLKKRCTELATATI
jgi:putative DNA primase/helicase